MLNRYDFHIIWTSMENHKSNFRTVVDKVAIICPSRSLVIFYFFEGPLLKSPGCLPTPLLLTA